MESKKLSVANDASDTEAGIVARKIKVTHGVCRNLVTATEIKLARLGGNVGKIVGIKIIPVRVKVERTAYTVLGHHLDKNSVPYGSVVIA